MSNGRFWASAESLVSAATIRIDRPKGSAHPRLPYVIYPFDYGYLEGTASGDGDGIDVWIGSLKAHRVTGILCTLDAGKRDAEIKILIGCSRADRQRILAFHNHERGSQAAILVIKPNAPAKRSGGLRSRVPRDE